MTYKRMKPSEYIDLHYAGQKKPCLKTIKRMIDRQLLAGEIFAGKYWVLVDDAGNPAPTTRQDAANELAQTGNAVADSLMHLFLERNNAA